MWDDIHQWRFRTIDSKEALTYLFIVLSLHEKILCRVQVPELFLFRSRIHLCLLFWLILYFSQWERAATLIAHSVRAVWNMFALKRLGLGFGFSAGLVFVSSSTPSNTILLLLLASSLTTLHHPPRHLWELASNHSLKGCLWASLMMTRNASLTQNIQENVNDNPFSDYIKFYVLNSIGLNLEQQIFKPWLL